MVLEDNLKSKLITTLHINFHTISVWLMCSTSRYVDLTSDLCWEEADPLTTWKNTETCQIMHFSKLCTLGMIIIKNSLLKG